MKHIDMILAAAWAILAVSYGIGYIEPTPFLSVMMAGMISIDSLTRYFK